jgi:hypothetical protein
MKLTRRQEEFVHKMFELRQEFDGPVHYSLLAERLGVSPFTAYDMLCLLEEKGYVTSKYQLSSDKCGPGRAERLFFPGENALIHEQRLVQKTGGARLEGEALKQYALEKLRQDGMSEGEKDLAEQLMARLLPTGQGDVRYCLEVMTIAALRLQRSAGWQALNNHLAALLPGGAGANRADLCLLGGFVFGLLTQQSAPGQEWLDVLREHLQGYMAAVMEMGSQDCNQLGSQLADLFAALGGRP